MNQFFSFLLKSSIAVFFGVCLLWQSSNAQETAPAIEWQKSLGGSDDDAASAIIQTTDGGYIVAGHSRSTDGNVRGHRGYEDAWIVKLTSIREIQWEKSLGGSGNDYAYSIAQTTDGGYIVAGSSQSTNGDVTGHHGSADSADSWIVKLTSGGEMEWQKSLGGSGNDYAYSIAQTSDGGYIAAGESSSTDGDVTGNHGGTDCWIVKLTSSGELAWQKSLGGSGNDGANSIARTTDGGYIVAGSNSSTNGDVTGNHGRTDSWIVKLRSGGELEWQKSLGGSDWEVSRSIAQTSDGGYMVAGWSQSNDGDVRGNHGSADYWIVKLTSTGTIEWQKSLGGSDLDYANSIKQTGDGGYIVAGEGHSNDGDVRGHHMSSIFSDGWIMKLTSGGELEWQKSLGGSDGDYATSIAQTSDGGYIIAGSSESTDGDVSGNHEKYDYWVVKLAPPNSTIQQPSPAIEWEKSLGGSDGDYATSIAQTVDGGYIIAGGSWSNDEDVSGHHKEEDAWIVKLTSTRNIQWQKSLGGSNGEVARSIAQTSDGGYIFAGYSESNDGDLRGNHGNKDSWIVKLTSEGDVAWQKLLDGSLVDYANSITQTSDGGYIAAGWSESTDGDVSGNHGEYDFWIVKLTSGGDVAWQKLLGGSSSDFANSIVQTSDSGYIVAGVSGSNDGDVTGHHRNRDYWIVKLTSGGEIEWQKSLGGSGSEEARSIAQTVDGGYIVAGYSWSNNGDVSGNHGEGDYWIVKLTSAGDVTWQGSLGGNRSDEPYSIAQVSDGGYIVAGVSASTDGDVRGIHGGPDCWIVKLTSSGVTQWQKSLGGSRNDVAYSIKQTRDGGYIIAGLSRSADGDVAGHYGSVEYADYWIVKLAPPNPTGVKSTEPTTPSPWVMNANYPNPFSSTTTITFTVPERSFVRLSVDTEQGVEVARLIEEHLEAGEYRVPFSGEGLASGTYLYRLTSGSTSLVGKMTVVR